ncbi:MAG: DUF3096 domain-containing protein [Nanoarchaeota archaeon]|nr:DUF3096 domain-containing protein [Nanoarchaeota archaeon]
MLMIITLSAILAIIFGIIILIWPKALNLAVAIWLILTGVLQLIGGAYPDLSPF